jgi:hypothetical protein
MSDPEKQSIIGEVGSWVWGTIEGGFNEQQSISQIIVDAVIGMIPVVGDVTAVRDLVAVIIRLVDNPEKRKEKLEWLTLTLLLFALIPVAGGVIKGVGKLILKASEDVGRHAEILRDVIQFLNRVGEGDAIKFLKKLDFESHAAELRGVWKKLTQRLDDVLTATLKRAHRLIPDAMAARLQKLQQGIRDLAALGDSMIPDSLKELNTRLKAIQKKIYEGEWHDIGGAWESATREAEARLVNSGGSKKWVASSMPFPPDDAKSFHAIPRDPTAPGGWPDLTKPPWLDAAGVPTKIATFSGEIRAVHIQPGTKIRRIIENGSGKSGLFWSYELAADGPSWRKNCAVLDRWSKNGSYVELVVPDGGLWVWEGKIASQIDNDVTSATFGQYLAGGATQLFIDFRDPGHAAAKAIVDNLPVLPTNWTGLMGINVPPPLATVQKLAASELESKQSAEAAAAAAQRGLRAAGDGGDPPQPSPGP